MYAALTACPPDDPTSAFALNGPLRDRTRNESAAVIVCRPALVTCTSPRTPMPPFAPCTKTSLAEVNVCVPLLATVRVELELMSSLLTRMSPDVTVENDSLPPEIFPRMLRSPP